MIATSYLGLKEVEGVKLSAKKDGNHLLHLKFELVGDESRNIVIPEQFSMAFKSTGIEFEDSKSSDQFIRLTKEKPNFTISLKSRNKIPSNGTIIFSDKSIAHHKSMDGNIKFLNLCAAW